jgi:hypothetical protein
MEAVNVLDDILRPDARSPSNKASMIRELQLVTKYRRGLKVRSQTDPQGRFLVFLIPTEALALH